VVAVIATLVTVVVEVTDSVFVTVDVVEADAVVEVVVDVVVDLAQDAKTSDVTMRQVNNTQIALLFICIFVPPVLFRDFWKTG